MRLRQFWALLAAAFLVAGGAYFVLAISRPVTPSGLTYMPLGDSITQWNSHSGGYRCPLQATLVNAGYNASAVGLSGLLDRWTVTDCADNWEGHGGATTAEIQAWFDADNSMTQLKPNIILALVGTVDVRRGNISQGPNDLRDMLTDIFTQSPDSWVVVSTIPPLGSQVPFFDQVPAYNAAIMRVAAEFPRVSTIDFYTACNNIITACLGDDGIHPRQAGFDVLTLCGFGPFSQSRPIGPRSTGQSEDRFSAAHDGTALEGKKGRKCGQRPQRAGARSRFSCTIFEAHNLKRLSREDTLAPYHVIPLACGGPDDPANLK